MKVCLLPLLLMIVSVVFAVNGLITPRVPLLTPEHYQCIKQS
jgi:hypothetical protein